MNYVFIRCIYRKKVFKKMYEINKFQFLYVENGLLVIFVFNVIYYLINFLMSIYFKFVKKYFSFEN